MGTKKKSTTKTNQTTEQKPLDLVMPGYNTIASGVERGLADIQGVDYTGDFLAQAGELQKALPGVYQSAGSQIGNLIPQAQNFIDMGAQMPSFADSPLLSSGMQSFASTNPAGMQGAVNAAIDPYMRQLTEQILPGLQSQGIESGAYGGTRSTTTLPLMAIQQQGEQAQRVAAALAYEDFQKQQERILSGYGLSTERGLGEANAITGRLSTMPGIFDMNTDLIGGQADYATKAAQADLGNRQLEIDNALKQFQYDMTRPFMGYDTAAGILGSMTSGYGTTNMQGKTTTTEKTGGLGPIVAGGLGLASMAAGLPMAGGGSLGGSLLGGLFGAANAAKPPAMGPGWDVSGTY